MVSTKFMRTSFLRFFVSSVVVQQIHMPHSCSTMVELILSVPTKYGPVMFILGSKQRHNKRRAEEQPVS